MNLNSFVAELCEIQKLLKDTNYEFANRSNGLILGIFDGDETVVMQYLYYDETGHLAKLEEHLSAYIRDQDLGIHYYKGCWVLDEYYHTPISISKISHYRPHLKLWKELVGRLGEHSVQPWFDDDVVRFDLDYYDNRQIIIIKADGIYISGKRYECVTDELVAEIENKSKVAVEVFIKVGRNGDGEKAKKVMENALAEAGFIVEGCSVMS